jgi:hypothetical protein
VIELGLVAADAKEDVEFWIDEEVSDISLRTSLDRLAGLVLFA